MQQVKVDRHGQAKILSQGEIALLFRDGFTQLRDRVIFAVCLYTAARIAEVCALRDVLILRKANTKGHLATRTIPMLTELNTWLVRYKAQIQTTGYLLPGRRHNTHIHPDHACLILRRACLRVGLDGVSSHSFRRTALTQMSDAGIPLRIIQEISGHRNLEQLQRYLEVRPEQVRGAIASLSLLGTELVDGVDLDPGFVVPDDIEKLTFPDMTNPVKTQGDHD